MPSRLLPKSPKGKRFLYGSILRRRKTDRTFSLISRRQQALELMISEYPYLDLEVHDRIVDIYLDKHLNFGEKSIMLRTLLGKELKKASNAAFASSIEQAIADAQEGLDSWQKSNPNEKMRRRR